MSTSNGAAVAPPQNNLPAIKQFLNSEGISAKFKELLGNKAPGFITSVLQAVSSNKSLSNADTHSIYGAAAAAAVLDLPINNNFGFAYIVPYNEKQQDGTYKQVAQFQIGYKGIKQLALRSGEFQIMNDSDVREGEITHYDRLSGKIDFDWIQDPTERLTKKVIGYVSYFKLSNGFEKTHYMTVEELQAHGKKFSQTFKKNYGLWATDFDGMARKTVVKLNLSKNAPLSIETQLSKALVYDQSKVNDADTLDVEYVDNDDEAIPTHDELRALFDEKLDLLTADEQTNAQRILEDKEENSYNKLYTLLNSK